MMVFIFSTIFSSWAQFCEIKNAAGDVVQTYVGSCRGSSYPKPFGDLGQYSHTPTAVDRLKKAEDDRKSARAQKVAKVRAECARATDQAVLAICDMVLEPEAVITTRSVRPPAKTRSR